jgi:hypothetical protein
MSLVIIMVSLMIAFYFGLYCFSKNFYIDILFIDSKFSKGLVYQALPEMIGQIELGLFGIFFSMSVLIAGYIYESKSEEASRVLLLKSNLLPIFLFNMLMLFSFMLNEVFWDSYLQIIPLFINLLITGTSFYNTIRIISSKKEYLSALLKIVERKFELLHNELLIERLAQNFNYSIVNIGKVCLSYSPWSSGSILIKSNKVGCIKDISIDLLRLAVLSLDRNINEKIKVDVLPVPRFVKTVEITENKINLLICKTIGEFLNNDSVIATVYLPKDLEMQDGSIRMIQEKICSAFIVTKKDTSHQQFKEIFDGYRDTFLRAISNKDQLLVETMIAIFNKIISRFIKIVRYDPNQARLEKSSLRGGWESITEIARLIYEGVEEAVVSENERLLESILYFPIWILNDAIKADDHYIYEEFVSFPKYWVGLRKKYCNLKISATLFEHAAKSLKEFSNLYLSHYVKDGIDKNLEGFINYAFSLLKVIQNSIKNGIDLCISNEEQMSLIEGLIDSFDSTYYSVSDYEDELFYFMRERSYQDIIGISSISRFYSRVQIAKYEIVFALIANLLKMKNDATDYRIVRLIDILPANAEYITYIYQLMSGENEHHLWGWDWWDLNLSGKLEFRALDYNFEETYLMLLLVHVTDWSGSGIFNKINGYVYNQYSNNESNFKKALGMVSSSDRVFNVAIDRTKIDQLKTYLKNKTDEYDLERQKLVIDSQISEEKKEKFIDDIIFGYLEEIGLRSIYRIEMKERFTPNAGGKKVYGITKQMLKKDYFLNNEGIHLMGVGNYGTSIRHYENSNILSCWIEEKELDIISLSNIKDIVGNNYKDYIIISTLRQWYKIRDSLKDFFVDEWTITVKNNYEKDRTFFGRFKDQIELPILRIFIEPTRKEYEALYLLDLRTIGYCYSKESNSAELRSKVLLNDLNIDDSFREQILHENPDWLKKEKEPDKYLRGMALLTLATEYSITCKDISLRKISLFDV